MNTDLGLFVEDDWELGQLTLTGGLRADIPVTPSQVAEMLKLVDAGKKVLHVSTDPATNNGQVFGQVVGNRMTPIAHRAPGLAGAVLAREDVTPELICDGYHVHPAMCRAAIAASTTSGADTAKSSR